MSFSSETKEKLSKLHIRKGCCARAELAGLLIARSGFPGQGTLILKGENPPLGKRVLRLTEKGFGGAEEPCPVYRGGMLYGYEYRPSPGSFAMLDKLYYTTLPEGAACCAGSFLRGAFLGCGYIMDDRAGYHLEFSPAEAEPADYLLSFLLKTGINAHKSERRGRPIIYVKESEHIIELLVRMGASAAGLQIESSLVLHEVRNDVNRRVNCETANIARTIEAGARQIEDIELIKENIGLEKLPQSLRDAAYARLENPDSPLAELAEIIGSVSRSGVNHRLRKLSRIADGIRKGGNGIDG